MQLEYVIAQVESSNCLSAVRFESMLNNNHPQWIEGQLDKIQAANGCNVATALMIASTSWGKYQLLGANIYALGAKISLLEWWNDPVAQSVSFAFFINPHGFEPSEDIASWTDDRFLKFAAFYNGPGAPAAYAAAMQKVLANGD